jgi:hypothetical protein
MTESRNSVFSIGMGLKTECSEGQFPVTETKYSVLQNIWTEYEADPAFYSTGTEIVPPVMKRSWS